MIFMVRINKISVILKEEKKKRKKGLGTLDFGRNERVKEYNSVRFVENTLALHSRKRKLQKPGEWTVDSWLAKARKKNASNLQNPPNDQDWRPKQTSTHISKCSFVFSPRIPCPARDDSSVDPPLLIDQLHRRRRRRRHVALSLALHRSLLSPVLQVSFLSNFSIWHLRLTCTYKHNWVAHRE